MQLQRPVPASRISRLMQLGRLGSGIIHMFPLETSLCEVRHVRVFVVCSG